MASVDTGNLRHVSGELLRYYITDDGRHPHAALPYCGEAPAISAAIEHIRAGRLRSLDVTSATRWEGLPDTPAIAELLPGYEADGWYGFGMPRNTAAEIVTSLDREINPIIAETRIAERFGEWGLVAQAGSPDDLASFIAAETEKWGRVFNLGARAD